MLKVGVGDERGLQLVSGGVVGEGGRWCEGDGVKFTNTQLYCTTVYSPSLKVMLRWRSVVGGAVSRLSPLSSSVPVNKSRG